MSNYFDHLFLLPAVLRAAQICRYLVYSEADFEVSRPAGATRCTDGGEIWHGGVGPPKLKFLLRFDRNVEYAAGFAAAGRCLRFLVSIVLWW